MPKRQTKTYKKNLVNSILSKTLILFTETNGSMSLKDFDTIGKIMNKVMKKIEQG